MFCALGCFDSRILSPYTATGLAGSLRYIVLCALLALFCVIYIGLTLILIGGIQAQPPTP